MTGHRVLRWGHQRPPRSRRKGASTMRRIIVMGAVVMVAGLAPSEPERRVSRI